MAEGTGAQQDSLGGPDGHDGVQRQVHSRNHTDSMKSELNVAMGIKHNLQRYVYYFPVVVD